MNTIEIKLEDYRARDGERIAKVFTGRDRGAQVRQASRIDELEASCDEVKIIIPNNVYSINPSFLEEFLKNVVIKLGKEKFLKRFKFESLGAYNYEGPLMEAIDRILKEQTAIG